MAQKEAEITVDFFEDGSSQVSVKNIKGSSCKEATKFIEKGLGIVTSSEKTDEYFSVLTDKVKLYR